MQARFGLRAAAVREQGMITGAEMINAAH